jgi:hypothetical protein
MREPIVGPAASYTSEPGLAVTARVADFVRFPVDAVERRDAFLVNETDAAVIVWADRDPDVSRVLALVERKGMPVRVVGAPEKRPKAVRLTRMRFIARRPASQVFIARQQPGQ